MGFARHAVAITATAAIACGSLLGLNGDDDDDRRPSESRDGSFVLEAETITPPSDDGGATDAADAADAKDGKKLVFVSSVPTSAAFDGGADGANAFCVSLAKAAGIVDRSFVAYLFLDGLLVGGSHTGAGLEAEKGWFLGNGKRAFAPGILGLFPSPENVLAVDETGKDVDASAGVWIGSAGGLLGTGLFGANTCGEWTKTSGTARVGDPTSLAKWRDDGDRQCSQARHVYCFEQ